MIRLALALLLVGSAGYAAPLDRAAGDAVRLDKALTGYVAGKPQTCINNTRFLSSSTYGSTVLYRSGSTVRYRAELVGGCTAGTQDALIIRTPSTSTCSGDIVEIRDVLADQFRSACAFSEFTPYTRSRR